MDHAVTRKTSFPPPPHTTHPTRKCSFSSSFYALSLSLSFHFRPYIHTYMSGARRKIAELESVFHGGSWRRDPCCLYSIGPAGAAASVQATASAPTPLLRKVGLAARAVTRERLAGRGAREAARAGRGAGGGGKHAPSRAFAFPGPFSFPKCAEL